MPSMREQVLSALFDRLRLIAGGTVKRNEALPARVLAGGCVILRDGNPDEPDVTLNPRTEFYAHRREIEAFVKRPTAAAVRRRSTLADIGTTALAADRSVGSLAVNLFWSPPQTSCLRLQQSGASAGDPRRRQVRDR